MAKGRWTAADIEALKAKGVKVQEISGSRSGNETSPAATKPQDNYKALGRLKAGTMNKTEALYAQRLELQKHAGEILWWEYEPCNLRLGEHCYYRIDFMVLTADRELQAHEVKAKIITDDSLVKIRAAAEKFPFRFIMMKYEKGEWVRREF